jgi:hypothetical protein
MQQCQQRRLLQGHRHTHQQPTLPTPISWRDQDREDRHRRQHNPGADIGLVRGATGHHRHPIPRPQQPGRSMLGRHRHTHRHPPRPQRRPTLDHGGWGQDLPGGQRHARHPPHHPATVADSQGGHARGETELGHPHILVADHLPSRHLAGHHQHRHPLPGPLDHRHRAQHPGEQQGQPDDHAQVDPTQPRRRPRHRRTRHLPAPSQATAITHLRAALRVAAYRTRSRAILAAMANRPLTVRAHPLRYQVAGR